MHRKPGEVFEVREDRARIILFAGVAEVVETTDEAAEAAAQEADMGKRRKKKG